MQVSKNQVPYQANGKNQKTGSKSGFFTASLATSAIGAAAIFGSCSERDNPVGFRGSDTTTIKKDTVYVDSTKKDTSVVDSLERTSQYFGAVLVRYNGKEYIIKEDSLFTLPDGSILKFDHVNKASDTLRAETDVKIISNGKVVKAIRNLMKGSSFSLLDGSEVELLAVDLRTGKEVAQALVQNPIKNQTGERADQKYIILNEGETLVKIRVGGATYFQAINSQMFADYEKSEDRIKVQGEIYKRNFLNTILSGVISGHFMDVTLTQKDSKISFTLQAQDVKTGETFEKEISNINILQPVFEAFSMQANSKGPNYQLKILEMHTLGVFEAGRKTPDGYVDDYNPFAVFAFKVQEIVNGVPHIETQYVNLDIGKDPRIYTLGAHFTDLNSEWKAIDFKVVY